MSGHVAGGAGYVQRNVAGGAARGGAKDGMILPEHQKMQKRSQKLQSLQDRKKHCRKDLGKWAGASERVRNEIEEKHAQLQELWLET